jgi:dynein heavy chain
MYFSGHQLLQLVILTDIHTLSLGQVEDELHCQQLLNECLVNGDWMLLQNCHLSVNLTAALCDNVIRVTDSVHSQFRLWITTQPSDSFPCFVLQV